MGLQRNIITQRKIIVNLNKLMVDNTNFISYTFAGKDGLKDYGKEEIIYTGNGDVRPLHSTFMH